MKSKNSRIYLLICTLALCIGLASFGVYAALSASLNISGTLGFNMHNAMVEISGEVKNIAQADDDANYIKTSKNIQNVVMGSTSGISQGELKLGNLYFYKGLDEVSGTGKVLDIVTNLSQLSYLKEIEKQTKAKIEKYQTKNENINHILVDTKKLAKSNSRFGAKSKRQQYAEEKCNRKSLRFGGASYDDYFEKLSKTLNIKSKSKQKQANKNIKQKNINSKQQKKSNKQKSINNEQKNLITKQKSKNSIASHIKNFKDRKKIIKN